jgi:hypothetical protein
MGQIEWYPPGDPRLGHNVKNIEHSVSYTFPVVSGLIRYSTALMREASNILEMHRDQGDSEIGVVHNDGSAHGYSPDLDSIVYLADSEGESEREYGEGRIKKGFSKVNTNAYRSVQSIEFGHYTKGREHEGEGPRTRADHRRHWVKGIAPLRTAAKKMSANPRLSIK